MKLRWRIIVLVIMWVSLVTAIHAEEHQNTEKNRQNTAEASTARHDNFEIIITHNSQTELPPWQGNLFALKTGKSVDKVSPHERLKYLAPGNYVLMLAFKEKIPELQGHRPFTFSISPKAKTIFHLLIGAQHEPEVEYGVGRTGADFVESDPRRGRDYINFELPPGSHEPCLQKCKSDPNCDAYSYVASPEWSKARCWLIHGAAVPWEGQYAISGVITRNPVPYQVRITTEAFETKEN